MSSDEIKKAVKEANKEVLTELTALNKRVDKNSKQRTLLLVITALALVSAIVGILYGINREAALNDQVNTNRIVVCGQAKSVALAERKRPLPGEMRNHYLNRLEAQREQLIAAGGLTCPNLPGFATFSFLRGKAIAEIEEILRRIAPEKLRAVRSHTDDTASSQLPLSSTPVDGSGTESAGSPQRGEQPGDSASPPASSPPSHEHPSHHHPPAPGQTGSPPATSGGGGGSETASGSGEQPASGTEETGGGDSGGGEETPAGQDESTVGKVVGKVCDTVGEVKVPAVTLCPTH